MTSEIERVISKYQDKINKLEDLLKLKNELIEYALKFTYFVVGEERQHYISIEKKIKELEKELE